MTSEPTSTLLIQSVTALTSFLKVTNDRLYEVEKLVSGLQKENEELKVAKAPFGVLKQNFRAREYGITTSSLVCYIAADPSGNCYLYPTEDEALDHIREKMVNLEKDVCDEDGELREEFLKELAVSGKITINSGTYLLRKDIIYPDEHRESGSESQRLKSLRDSSKLQIESLLLSERRRQKIDEIKNSIREYIEPT